LVAKGQKHESTHWYTAPRESDFQRDPNKHPVTVTVTVTYLWKSTLASKADWAAVNHIHLVIALTTLVVFGYQSRSVVMQTCENPENKQETAFRRLAIVFQNKNKTKHMKRLMRIFPAHDCRVEIRKHGTSEFHSEPQ
jgi:hypothetical protein